MSTLKAILVDDERNALKALETVLGYFPEISIVGSYTDPLQALEKIEHVTFDIAFLDIDMPVMNGLELSEQFMEKRPSVDVVFTTAYDQYALEAFEVSAADYLLKPIRRERLVKTIRKLADKRVHLPLVETYSGRIVCFGSFQLLIPELETRVKWRTNKTRELFAYLVHHRCDNIHKSKIVEDLWPDMDQERAIVHLHTSVYQIRKTIRQFGLESRMAIRYANESYYLFFQGIYCDADEFIQAVEKLGPISPGTVEQYEQAAGLYRGNYFEENDFLWALPLRQKLLLYYIDTVRQLVDFYMQRQAYAKAAVHLQRLVDLSPLQEESHELLLTVYAELEDRAALVRHFRLMETRFSEEGLEVTASAKKLYRRLHERLTK